MTRRALWMLLLLGLACGPRPVAGPDSPGLRPAEVATGFAVAVLGHARADEALLWSEPGAALDVRSQVGFLAVPGREVRYWVEQPRQEAGAWTVPVTIQSLELGEARYQGQMLLRLAPDGRRVSSSGLELERSDGVKVSL